MAQYKTIKNFGLEKDEPTNILEIENLEHRKSIIKDFKVVIIDYYTTWCGPCKKIKHLYSDLYGKHYEDKYPFVIFVKEDIGKKFGDYIITPTGVPCFHFYINGEFQKDLSVVGGDLEKVKQNIDSILFD